MQRHPHNFYYTQKTTMQTLQHQFPILYGYAAANSKMKMWDISVYTIDHIPTIITKHGYIDGKIQTLYKAIDIGKNMDWVGNT